MPGAALRRDASLIGPMQRDQPAHEGLEATEAGPL